MATHMPLLAQLDNLDVQCEYENCMTIVQRGNFTDHMRIVHGLQVSRNDEEKHSQRRHRRSLRVFDSDASSSSAASSFDDDDDELSDGLGGSDSSSDDDNLMDDDDNDDYSFHVAYSSDNSSEDGATGTAARRDNIVEEQLLRTTTASDVYDREHVQEHLTGGGGGDTQMGDNDDSYACDFLDDLRAGDISRMISTTAEIDSAIYCGPMIRLMKDYKPLLKKDDLPYLAQTSAEELERKERHRLAASGPHMRKYKGMFENRFDRYREDAPLRHNSVVLIRCPVKHPKVDAPLYFGFASLNERAVFMRDHWFKNGSAKARRTIFTLDKRFPKPIPFFAYSFTSVNPHSVKEVVKIVNGELQGTEARTYTRRFFWRRGLSMVDCLLEARPLPWNCAVWRAIVEHLLTRKAFVEDINGGDKDDADSLSNETRLHLPESAFADAATAVSARSDSSSPSTPPSALSDVFFDHVESNLLAVDREDIGNRALKTLAHTAVYLKYFFHRELKYLNDNWFSSMESLLSLRPRALYALYHMLHPRGCPLVKAMFFKYLYMRDKTQLSKLRTMALAAYPRIDGSGGARHRFRQLFPAFDRLCPSSSSSGARRFSIFHLFKCSTYRFSWELPLFSATTFVQVARYARLQRALYTMSEKYGSSLGGVTAAKKHAQEEFDRLRAMIDIKREVDIHEDEQDGSTCTLLSELRYLPLYDDSDKFDEALEELTKKNNSISLVRLDDAPAMLVPTWRHQYSEMALAAIRQMFETYMLPADDHAADVERARLAALPVDDYHRVYEFPEAHPVSELRCKLKASEMSSEQLGVVQAMECLPFVIAEGIPGSGKTEAMCAVTQCYHPDAVICIAAQNATLLEVIERRVGKKAFTSARLGVLHAQRCCWRMNTSAAKEVHQYNSLKLNPFKGRADVHKNTAKRHLYYGDFYDEKFGSFTHCPLSEVKLVVIDEASLLAPDEFCNIISMFTRCCVKPPKFLIGGDRAQLPAIANGDLLGALVYAFPWAAIRFQLCFRFEATSLLARNAVYIRDGEPERITFDKVTKRSRAAAAAAAAANARNMYDEYEDPSFGCLSSAMTKRRQSSSSPPSFEVSKNSNGDNDAAEWHLINILEPPYHDKACLDREVSDVMEYLLKHESVFKAVHELGETSAYQIVCPTRELCKSVFRVMEREVFRPRALAQCTSKYMREPEGDATRLYKGMKFTYGRNVYGGNKFRLCNNLVMIVIDIEEVKLERIGGRAAAANASVREILNDSLGGAADDLVMNAAVAGGTVGTRSSTDTTLCDSESNRTSKWEEVIEELQRYSFENAPVYKCANNAYTGKVPCTLVWRSNSPITPVSRGAAAGNSSSSPPFDVGWRVVAVPASDVLADGTVKDFSNRMYIPWTTNHIHHIRPASAVTVHSAQGTEYDCVLAFMFAFTKHLTREMLHVAATRAKKTFICASSRKVLEKIVENKSPERNIYLGQFLRSMVRREFVVGARHRLVLERPSPTKLMLRAQKREEEIRDRDSKTLTIIDDRERRLRTRKREREREAAADDECRPKSFNVNKMLCLMKGGGAKKRLNADDDD